MALLPANALMPRPAEPALPGSWRLAAGRAITLEPREAGVLKVAHGRLWATREGPHSGPLNDLGDEILETGERLSLGAGQRLVIEAWNHGAPAYFTWDPLPEAATRPVYTEVTKPMADLRSALGLVGAALGRLAAGVAVVGWQLATGGGRRTQAAGCCGEGAAG